MNLFTNFLDVRVHDLPPMEWWCSKHIFIHRTPVNRHNVPVSKLKKRNYADGKKQRTKTVTYMRTLCLPMTKETLRLHGLTKLDQLLSTVMYSPFLAKKRIEEWSNGWPAYCKTVGGWKVKHINIKQFKELNAQTFILVLVQNKSTQNVCWICS